MAKTAKTAEPKEKKVRRSRAKETFSELKKVNWPTFGKTMKQTGMVLAIVVGFTALVLGIDTLVGYLIGLLTKI